MDNRCYQLKFLPKPSQDMSDLISYDFQKNYTAQWFMPSIVNLLKDKSIKKITYRLKALLKFFNDIADSLSSIEDLELMQYTISAGKPQEDLLETIKKAESKDSELEIINNFSKNYQKLLQDLKNNRSLALYREIDVPLGYILHNMEKKVLSWILLQQTKLVLTSL